MARLKLLVLSAIVTVGALIIAPSTSALAQDATSVDHLTAARKLAMELDHQEVLIHATEALKSPTNTKADLIEIYKLLAIAQGTLRQPEAAKESFKRLIALSPQYQLPEGRSPKILRPFQEAGGFWIGAPDGLTLSAKGPAQSKPASDLLITARLSDRLSMVDRLEITYKDSEGVAKSQTLPTNASQSFTIPGSELAGKAQSYEVNVLLRAVNQYGGELANQRVNIRIDALPSAIKELPVVQNDPVTTEPAADPMGITQSSGNDDRQAKPIYKKWWFLAAVGVGAVAITTGAILATSDDGGVDLKVSTETKGGIFNLGF